MRKKRLISILIATKNRQRYCLSAVESILSISSDEIEVVIQDNSDERNLASMLGRFLDDDRLVYRYTPPPFSSIDNFNAAIELANGEYICLIGDDDGINPEIIEATRWAKDNKIDSLVGNISANYRWEGTGAQDTFFTKMTGGTLTILGFNARVKEVDIETSLNKLMDNGCTNYLEFPLPKLYHGIVRKAVLDKIKQETGEYLKGLSPDIYSAIALACNVNRLITIDYPLTIPGVCGQSTSITEGQLKKHSKRLEDAPHFRDRGDYDWSIQVPRIYCVQTIWADSGFAALREMNRQDLLVRFNKYSLYANILIADPSLKLLLEERIADDKKNNDFDSFTYGNVKIQKRIKNILVRVVRRSKIILRIKELVILKDLPNINHAMNALNVYLKRTKYKLREELAKLNTISS